MRGKKIEHSARYTDREPKTSESLQELKAHACRVSSARQQELEYERKLLAFTLVDVLAGMVIMSIVVTMVFGAFNMVNRQTHDFQKMRLELNDFELMQADLSRQIDLCEHIYEIPAGFVLEKDQKEIRYFTSEGSLIRQTEESRDVLHPSVARIKLEKQEHPAAQKTLITGITVESNFRDQIIAAHFQKAYSQAAIINKTLLHEF